MNNRPTVVAWGLMFVLTWTTRCLGENVPLVLRNVRVFDGEKVLSRATVVVQGRTIQTVGATVPQPEGATIIEGEGMTLLPGLIDAHVHNIGEPLLLRQAAAFGVTTALNMFTWDPKPDVERRKEQDAGLATNRCDLLTAGIGVTAAGGHGTEYGFAIPTLDNAEDAQVFIDARLAEGADYIKIIIDPGAPNRKKPIITPTLSRETAAAAVAAAKRRGKLAVMHIWDEKSAIQALEIGADGLVHVYADGAPNRNFARLAKAQGAFVIPTLTVIEAWAGRPAGGALADDPRLAPYIRPDLLKNLSKGLPAERLGPTESYAVAEDTVRLLKEEGVTILAGSDCDNRGTAHGVSVHREIELLVRAGLTPLEALCAATSATATAFHLNDRGRIKPGLRADLLLVKGDPTKNILATRDIAGVWKEGCAIDREAFKTELQEWKPKSEMLDFLPPVLPWKGASEGLIAKPDDPWITPSEKTDLTDTPNYDETIAYLKKLAAASPLISLQEFGRTSLGRTLYVVVAAKDRIFTAEGARKKGRPTLLVQAGIHAGEIDGKDAGLMLLRDIALRGKASLLDSANLLFVPVFNADGHERSSRNSRANQRGPLHQGWRNTAQNLNLNRDYMKADTPEMQAMLGLINQWSPMLYVDVHVSDGIDQQYDITFCYNGDLDGFAWSPHISKWLNETYRPSIETALKAAGHIPGQFFDRDDEADLSEGLLFGTEMPRYSQGYGDLRHLPTVLVETHSLKPYRQRVLGTYVLLESSLRTLGARAKELRRAVVLDASAMPASLPMNRGKANGERRTIDFLGVAQERYVSSATGRSEIRWLGTPRFYQSLPVQLDKPELPLRRPKAYWVPVTKPEVIARLKLHGIQMDTLTAQRTMTIEMYRLVNVQPQTNSGFHPFEGRHTLTTGVKVEIRKETFSAGSVRVATDQPLGDLAIALLEPESNDSFLAWGFFLEILQRTEYIEGYVLAPMAERMLADNPKLKADFETKLAGDPKFAADPAARMRWFYERSPPLPHGKMTPRVR
ncbi:MAG: amidohydrolase family protein [Verrucomicrobiales bacterium]|nr:amidohydrolase family protein [Verrucomicrobiales bacterium]